MSDEDETNYNKTLYGALTRWAIYTNTHITVHDTYCSTQLFQSRFKVFPELKRKSRIRARLKGPTTTQVKLYLVRYILQDCQPPVGLMLGLNCALKRSK